MARKLSVEIIGDSNSLSKAFQEASGHTSRFGGALGGLAKAGLLAGGAAGVGAVLVTLKAGIGDFTESTKVAAQTGAVIKSTGGSAKVTAKQVGDLASAISNYSGVDDEAVQAGENMLLTFTNIRNGAGKNNKIFDQSTKILADMSTAMGGDMSKSAIQLGKALNDPVKGVTALTKVGVTFTDAQKASIKAMVDAGNTAGAQKVILAELNKEFGGSAEAAGKTLPGQLNILKNTFGNLAGELVGKAVPALTQFSGWFSREGMPKIQEFFGALGNKIGPVIDDLVGAFKSAGPGIMNVLTPIGNIVRDVVVPLFQKLGEIGAEAIKKIGDILRNNGPQIHDIFENIGKVMKNLGEIVVPILKFAFDTVLPIAIKVLIPVLKTVTDAIAFISDVATRAIGIAVTVFKEGPGKIKDAFVAAWNAVEGAVTGVFGGVRTHVANLISDLVGFWRDLPGRIADAVKSKANELWNGVKHIFDKLPGFIKDALGIASPSKVFEEIGEAIIHGAIKGIENKSGDLLRAAEGAFSSLLGPTTPGVSPRGGVPGGLGPGQGGGTLIALGHALQSMGFQVSENPAFGGVSPVHAKGSYHYLGRAIDVNWPGGGPVELAHLRSVFAYVRSFHPIEEMIEAIGGANQHLHVALAKGGIVTSPTLALIGERGPEAVIPLGRGGGTGGRELHVHFHNGTFIGGNKEQVARDLYPSIRNAIVRAGRSNGGGMLGGQG
jgi:phage-related protein